MNEGNGTTLWQFLFAPGAAAEAAGVEARDELRDVRNAVAEKFPAPVRAALSRTVDDNVKQMLDVPIGNLIVGAWATARTLAKYSDDRQHPPEEIVLLPLKEHTIKSAHKPSIDVVVNDQSIEAVTFDLDLALTLQGAMLKIQAGRIRELHVGQCAGRGTLKCGATVLVERKTRTVRLPGVLTFPNGVPIRPRDWHAQPPADLQK